MHTLRRLSVPILLLWVGLAALTNTAVPQLEDVGMSSFIVSDLRILGQLGTTIGLGLLFDTLIVRSFMTPSIATLLGRWFWWPQTVRPRPASQMLRPYGPRPAVRQLLLCDDEDAAVTSESPSHSG
jgi:RND superfamily putative drug exporter